jgi:hypothetical protein
MRRTIQVSAFYDNYSFPAIFGQAANALDGALPILHSTIG